jgi:ATP-dependent exoDNAse (exonuclease V) alpha subunit
MEEEVKKIFRGLNVIIIGDFHQFPPVVAHQMASLYCLANPQYDSEDKVLGCKIYEQFTTIVQLKDSMERAGLIKDVELAIGAPIMVTLNIHMDLDIANGVRGIIEEIVLNEQECQIGSNEHSVQLHYSPCYVLVKLLHTKAAQLCVE